MEQQLTHQLTFNLLNPEDKNLFDIMNNAKAYLQVVQAVIGVVNELREDKKDELDNPISFTVTESDIKSKLTGILKDAGIFI